MRSLLAAVLLLASCRPTDISLTNRKAAAWCETLGMRCSYVCQDLNFDVAVCSVRDLDTGKVYELRCWYQNVSCFIHRSER